MVFLLCCPLWKLRVKVTGLTGTMNSSGELVQLPLDSYVHRRIHYAVIGKKGKQGTVGLGYSCSHSPRLANHYVAWGGIKADTKKLDGRAFRLALPEPILGILVTSVQLVVVEKRFSKQTKTRLGLLSRVPNSTTGFSSIPAQKSWSYRSEDRDRKLNWPITLCNSGVSQLGSTSAVKLELSRRTSLIWMFLRTPGWWKLPTSQHSM